MINEQLKNKEESKYSNVKTWNEGNYNEFVKYLISIQDKEYKEFHSSIVLNSKYEMIGIRVPIMRNIAKNMAEAWLICEMYIKFPRNTKEFLENNDLNKFTQNKAISKIHDSYRVSNEEKEILNNYRK